MIFDKAETAEKVDIWRAKLAELAEKRKALAKQKDAEAKRALARIDAVMEKIEAEIRNSSQALAADDA
jgi:chromosome segregation ATPase